MLVVWFGGHSVVVAWRAVSDLGGSGVLVVVNEFDRGGVGADGGAMMWTKFGFCNVCSRTEPTQR